MEMTAPPTFPKGSGLSFLTNVFLACALFLPGLAAAATISGTVRKSADTTQALANAKVVLLTGATHSDSGFTDSLGHYAFSGVATGSKQVQASLAGYAAATSATISITTSGQAATANVSLQTLGGISGKVRKASDSTAIANALLQLRTTLDTTTVLDSVRTDSSGNYAFVPRVAGVNYRVTCIATGFLKSTHSPDSVVNGITKTRNFLLQAPGLLSGEVRNSKDSVTPVANALVVLRRTSATTNPILDSIRTDAAGHYAFANVAPGTPNYWVVVTATNFAGSNNGNIAVGNGASVTSNVYLDSILPGSISGKAFRITDSTPVANTGVFLRRGSTASAILDSTVTDSSGGYAFANVAPGALSYILTFNAAGFVKDTLLNLTVNNGSNTVSNAYMTALGSLGGRIRRTGDSAGVANALVVLRRTNATPTFVDSARTDSAGNYAFKNLVAAATYRVVGSATGYASDSLSNLTVSNGVSSTVNVTLKRLGALAGRVRRSADSLGIANALVVLRRTSPTTVFVDSARADSAGNYAFKNLTASTYRVVASASGYAADSVSSLGVVNDSTRTQHVYLKTLGRVQAVVRRLSDSTSIAGALVTIAQTTAPIAILDSGRTDSLGGYLTRPLTAGSANYVVNVVFSGFIAAANSNLTVANGLVTTSAFYLGLPGSISGKIRRAADSAALPNASVYLRRNLITAAIQDSAKTDSLGNYAFLNLTPGTPNYLVTASASNYFTTTNSGIAVGNGAAAVSDVYLPAIAVGSIAGKVRKATDSTGIKGASVYLRRNSAADPVQDSAITDSLGGYAFTGLLPGTPNYYVTASAKDYVARTNANLALGNGTVLSSDVYLVHKGRILGIVRRLPDSAGVANALVLLRRGNSGTSPLVDSARTDSTGAYLFPAVDSSTTSTSTRYRVYPVALGYAPDSAINQNAVNGGAVTCNFLLKPLGAVSGTVRRQADSTTILAGAQIYLRRGTATATPQDSVKTDSLGRYAFANLAFGGNSYFVTAGISGYYPTTTGALAVASGAITISNVYLANIVPGGISGKVRSALDSSGVPGAQLYLTRTSGSALDSTRSDSAGNYAFANVAPGTPNYSVAASATGYIAATNANISVGNGATVASNLFLSPLGRISGRVRRAADSTGLPGVLILLRRTSATSPVQDSARTDSLGDYRFVNLTPGAPNYYVTASLATYFPVTNANLAVTSGGTSVSNVFLTLIVPGSVSGRVRRVSDSTGVAGALLLLRRGTDSVTVLDSARSDSAGAYAFTRVDPGTPNYWIWISANGFIPAVNADVAVGNGAIVASDAFLTLASNITGKVRRASDSATAIANALVLLRRGGTTSPVLDSARTDAAGNYVFLNLAPGTNYRVTAGASGFVTLSNGNLVVTLGAVTTANVYLGTTAPGTLSGVVRRQDNALGLRNALLVLRRGTDSVTVLDSVRSDSVGAYAFLNVPSGDPAYRVTASAAGFVTGVNSGISMGIGAAATSNFSLVPATGTLSGTIRKSSDTTVAVANALVLLRRGSDTASVIDSTRANAQGAYAFSGVPAGSPNYGITVSAVGYVPAVRGDLAVSIGGATVANVSLTPAIGSISGWVRTLGDGSGIAKARVQLFRGTDSVTVLDSVRADGQGNYAFANVASGGSGYRIAVTAASYVGAVKINLAVTTGGTAVANFSLAAIPLALRPGAIAARGFAVDRIGDRFVLRVEASTAVRILKIRDARGALYFRGTVASGATTLELPESVRSLAGLALRLE